MYSQEKTLNCCKTQVLVVDLDDTLVETSKLNNDAYDYAFQELGLEYAKKKNRTTRNDFNSLTEETKSKIVILKQKYFSQNWLKYRVTLNKKLLKKLHRNAKQKNFLWTASDPKRAKKIVEQLGLDVLFDKIIYDDKLDILASVNNLKTITQADTMTFYENDKRIVNELHGLKQSKSKIVDKIDDDQFCIVGLKMDISTFIV